MVRVEKYSKGIETFIDDNARLPHQREVSGSKLPHGSRAQQTSEEPHPAQDRSLHNGSPTSGAEDIHTPSRDEGVVESERLLRSKTLAKSPRLRHLLAHIVKQWADGNINRLDGYNIAIDVFQRDTFFDSGLDPIVRVEIARLRKQIAKYYETEAQGSVVRIEIPKGTYIPVFFRQAKALEDGSVQGACTLSVLVLPFTVQEDGAPISLYDYLLCQLTQESGLRVVSRTLAAHLAEGRGEGSRQDGPRFLIEGCASCADEQYHMIFHLSDNLRGYNVWSGRYTATAKSIAEIMSLAVRDLASAMQAAAFLN